MTKAVDAMERLRALVAEKGTQRDAAQFLGISHPYLCDLLKENRRLTPRILSKLGLEEVTEIRESR